MSERRLRSHWLVDVARAERFGGADALAIDATTSTGDAWRIVARASGLSEAQLAASVAAYSHLATADLATAQAHAGDLIPERLARERLVFPLRETDHQLVVASADPADEEVKHLIMFGSGRRAVLEIAPPAAIQAAIDARYAPDRAVERLLKSVGAELHVQVEPEITSDAVAAKDAGSAPTVKLTHLILGDAVRARASDIHLEPAVDGGRVRFRVDGVLRPYTRLSGAILNRVVSCIKIMGGMDIADRLRPHDGRARIRVDDHPIDLRISTVPTRDSEKAVVRLLDPRNARRLEDLSISTAALVPLRTIIGRRDGIVLVTGPTGSGKTTLLYAALREMPSSELNIMTVEDPIEYELTGMTQIQVEPKRGVTFATALRSILRQDPDVIFIGEIRDAETAAIAVQASLTGHLVLAALHTNDAVGSVGRLTDLGVERHEIASTLRGATAQRLVRKVCLHCVQKITGPLTEIETRLAIRYGVVPTVRAIGCPMCAHTGYFGRIPLFEVLVSSPPFESAILADATSSQLEQAAIAAGMRPLKKAAADRVTAGDTTLEEIDRELGESDPDNDRPATAAPHVLIADDDAVTRAIARAVLVNNGFRVSEAEDGVVALRQLETLGDVSLLVLDLAMPQMDGREVLRRLRSSLATCSLPVIVLTGDVENQTEIDLMEAGADDYVRKPIQPERFIVRIKATLRRSQL